MSISLDSVSRVNVVAVAEASAPRPSLAVGGSIAPKMTVLNPVATSSRTEMWSQRTISAVNAKYQ
jgi:hypothetical protein